MSDGQSGTIDIERCPECGFPHPGLKITKVQALTSFRANTTRRVEAIFLCPNHNVLFTLTLEEYEEEGDRGLAI